MNKIKFYGLLIGIALMVSACGTSAAGDQVSLLEEKPVETTKVLEMEMTDNYKAIGSVKPGLQVDLYLASGGEVDYALVKAGDQVAKGDTLLVLTTDDLESNFNATESTLRTSRDNLYLQYLDAQSAYTDSQILYEAGALSLDALNAQKQQMDILQKQYSDANVSYQNKVATLKDGFDDRELTTPIDGTVAAVYVSQYEKAQNQIAVSLTQNDQFVVEVSVPADIKKVISIQDEVSIKSEYLDQPVKGEIASINEIPDAKTNLYVVKIVSDSELVIGEYVEVNFIKTQKNVMAVPASSVIRRGEKAYVYAVVDGMIKLETVTTGLSKDNFIEIISSNADLSDVVISGFEQISEGDPVIIINKN